MRLSLKLGIALAILAFATSAFATNINFNYSGSGFTGSGVFTATAEGGGTYLVTGVSGQQNGLPFTGVIAGDGNIDYYGSYQYDDLLYLNSTPQLDDFGVLLSWSGGGSVNLGNDGHYELWNDANGSNAQPIGFSASATPEPSTLLTLGSGLIGLAGLARKRFFS